MPGASNTVSVAVLSAAALERPQVAVGMQLSRVQLLTQIAQDESAPQFSGDQEPLQDGRAYKASDGLSYYRPQLRVAQRAVTPIGPDVRFYKDVAGKVRLQFELEEVRPAGLPADAVPFNVRVEQVVLRWQGGQRVFDRPTLARDEDDNGPTGPAFALLIGAELAAEEVQPIYLALRTPASRARLDVQLAYSYYVDAPALPQRPPEGPPIIVRPGDSVTTRPGNAGVTRPESGPPVVRPGGPVSVGAPGARIPASPPRRTVVVRTPGAPVVVRRRQDFGHVMGDILGAGSTPSAGDALLVPATRVQLQGPVLSASVLRSVGTITDMLRRADERARQPNYKTATIAYSVPFIFDPSLDHHRPIYSMLESEAALDEQWTDTSFGPICRAPFPNTVYRLPDEVRLAYNVELGTPHLLPTLYRDDDENVRVRVTMRVMPWHNPDQLVKLRDHLHRSSSGALAAPTITVGGYKSAKLHLTSAFPEQIQAITGQEIEIDLERGSEIILDLSLEFYRFLAELLSGPVGLTGEVSVALSAEAPAGGGPAERVRRVPMRLSLGSVARLPYDVQVEQQTVSPTEVLLVNRSRADMQVGGCVPRLLQYDANSVVPIEVFDATTTTNFPTTLAADATLSVAIKPAADQELLWNAVQIELIDQRLTRPAQEVLDRIHEVAPSGTLSWVIEVECPPLLQNPLPARFENLFRVEVELSRPGFKTQQVVLRRGQAVGKVTMQRSLREILSPDAGGVEQFEYRVRNIYNDREGTWGAPRTGAGSSIAVFPNPPETDI